MRATRSSTFDCQTRGNQRVYNNERTRDLYSIPVLRYRTLHVITIQQPSYLGLRNYEVSITFAHLCNA